MEFYFSYLIHCENLKPFLLPVRQVHNFKRNLSCIVFQTSSCDNQVLYNRQKKMKGERPTHKYTLLGALGANTEALHIQGIQNIVFLCIVCIPYWKASKIFLVASFPCMRIQPGIIYGGIMLREPANFPTHTKSEVQSDGGRVQRR